MTNSTETYNPLSDWNVYEQENRVLFMEFLYEIFDRKNGLYTGLWDTYKDMISVFVSEFICENLRAESTKDD